MSYGTIIKNAAKFAGIESAGAAKKIGKTIGKGIKSKTKRPPKKRAKPAPKKPTGRGRSDSPFSRMDDSARREFKRQNLK